MLWYGNVLTDIFLGIGFGVYGSYPEQDRVEAQKKAFDQFVSFFVKN